MGIIHPVILCGGSGTRLWPRSRAERPKPFIELLGETTLFCQTLERVGDPALFAAPTIVAGNAHVEWIERQYNGRDGAQLVVEPAARNTAPAIVLAALALPPEALMLVCPSDHHISDSRAFEEGVKKAARLAEKGFMVAFGIAPTAPETGYGYIKLGEPLEGGHTIARFVEKPDRDTAMRYLADGGYAWNGGIFLFRAGTYLEELERHRPQIAAQARAAHEGARIEGWKCLPAAAPFESIAGESIDYAVMENTDRAVVVAADMGWSDIGNWDALSRARESDGDGNVVSGRADLVGCRNVMVESDGPRVSAIGLEDVIVVVDGDEVLVTTRDGAQSVGKLPGAEGR